jgi:hypothetical protein
MWSPSYYSDKEIELTHECANCLVMISAVEAFALQIMNINTYNIIAKEIPDHETRAIQVILYAKRIGMKLPYIALKVQNLHGEFMSFNLLKFCFPL